MIIDCGPELRGRCGEILSRGGWETLTAEERWSFEALPFSHGEARQATRTLDSPEEQAVVRRGWIEFFRENWK